MSKHSTNHVDTLALTDDTQRPLDELIVAIYHAERVSLEEAKTMAESLIKLYELTHKTADVTVDRNDIDSHAFEAMFAGLVAIREYEHPF